RAFAEAWTLRSTSFIRRLHSATGRTRKSDNCLYPSALRGCSRILGSNRRSFQNLARVVHLQWSSFRRQPIIRQGSPHGLSRCASEATTDQRKTNSNVSRYTSST